jgi:hypothetical protein
MANLSGHVEMGYGKMGKKYNNSKNTLQYDAKNRIIFVRTRILIDEFTNFSFYYCQNGN